MSNARFSILQARAISDKRVSDAQFRTLAALGMYADKDGWCYPSLKTLGKDLNKSAQAVGRDTIALRKLGYLQVKNRYDAKTKSRHSNLYRLVFDFNVDDSTLSTSYVDTLSTSDVEVNVPINDPIKRYSAIAKKLENLTGALKGTDAPLISAWVEKHTDQWIEKALEIAKDKGARSSAYVDRILIGWEANGYPKTREQQVSERKGEKKQEPKKTAESKRSERLVRDL